MPAGLTSEGSLSISAIRCKALCLLDARQLSQPRYRDNDNFRDQLATADIIIANKQETYTAADREMLAEWRRAGTRRQT